MNDAATLEMIRLAGRNNYLVRRMTAPEVELAVDWAAQEGWNPGLNDAECFYAADRRGFFVGLLDGQPIGCSSAVLYGDRYAFFGNYIVRPEYRGLGYGLRMTQARLAHVGRRNVGLDGVVEMEPKYARLGFRTAHRNLRYRGSGEGRRQRGVVDLTLVPFDKLAGYDELHFGAPRQAFLKTWIHQAGSTALGCVREGHLRGYGVLRPCRQGCKIGPLFADDEQTADDLLVSLIAERPGETFYLDVPQCNPAAEALAARHGMEVVFETARMYISGMPSVPMGHIYGITTFELG